MSTQTPPASNIEPDRESPPPAKPISLFWLIVAGVLAVFVLSSIIRQPANQESKAQPEIYNTGKPTYFELCDVNATTSMTDVQKEAYAARLVGTRISGWKRYVWDVRDTEQGYYEVALSSTSDLKTWGTLVETTFESGAQLSKGQLWEFTGTVKSVSVYGGGCTFVIDSRK